MTAPTSFITEWNAETGILRAVAVPAGTDTPAGTGTPAGGDPGAGSDEETSVGFRTVTSVAFAQDGEVCGVDMPDIPEHVAPAIPPAHGRRTVGSAWLDSGWLWIPLRPGRTAHQRSGLAEVELRLRRHEVTDLSVHFLGGENGT